MKASPYVVGALLFPAEDYSQGDARAWAKAHGYRAGPLYRMANHYEIPQVEAALLDGATWKTLHFGNVLARVARATGGHARGRVPWSTLTLEQIDQLLAHAEEVGDVVLAQRARRARVRA